MSEAALHRAMRALAEVSDQLVLVGGTAQRLFPMHPLGRDPGFDLLSTEDVDLAAPLAIRVPAETDLLERLREAGFEAKVSGADRAKWTYPLRDGDGAYLEFIAPRVGSGIKRNEQPDLVLRFSGIHAEKLPNVHALLHRPWEVELESADTRIRFQVVNPITYIAQKLITMQGRPPLKRGKDLLYVFDTLAIFGDHLDILGEQESVLLPALNKKQRRSVAKAFKEHCTQDGPTTRTAAAIASEQRPSPPTSPQIATACTRFLPRLLPGLLGEATNDER